MVKTSNHWTSLLNIFGVIVTVAILIYFYQLGIFTSKESAEIFLSRMGIFAPIVFMLIQFIQVLIPLFPGSITIPLGSIIFGPVNGFIYNFIGIIIGSVINFYIGRNYGEMLVEKLVGTENYQKGITWLEKSRFDVFFGVSMAVPVAPADLICYVAGLSQLSFKKFFIILITTKPWTLLAYTVGTQAILEWSFALFG